MNVISTLIDPSNFTQQRRPVLQNDIIVFSYISACVIPALLLQYKLK